MATASLCVSVGVLPLFPQHHREALDTHYIMAGLAITSSRRGLLASLWTLVTALTAVAFLTALGFTLQHTEDVENDYDYNNAAERGDFDLAVTSRAMGFCAMWTAILATLLAIFGAVILGWQSPTGQYYTCCSPQVHKTTPIAMGSFIGALFMFANLTLVNSLLFAEFEVRVLQWCSVLYNFGTIAAHGASSPSYF